MKLALIYFVIPTINTTTGCGHTYYD